MSEFNRPENMYAESGISINAYITRVFTIMGLGVALTAAVAFLGYNSLMNGGILASIFFGNAFMIFVPLIVQLGIAIAMGTGLTKFNTTTLYVLFFVYSAITGITFSVLPAAYGIDTLGTAFLFAAVLFVSCAIIGHTTSVDLSRFTGLLFGALLAVVIVSVLGIFIPALRGSLLIGYAGLIVFLGLTAFDMQKIKQYYYVPDEKIKGNLAVYSAFQLYLDFINILLYILRILGNSKSRR